MVRNNTWLGIILWSLLLMTANQAKGSCLSPVGDLNGNGITNVGDVQCIILTVLWTQAGNDAPVPSCLAEDLSTADVNCDGATVVTDVVLVIYWALSAPLSTDIDADGNLCPDACETVVTDADGDGVDDDSDCAPYDPWVYPGAVEMCNGTDDDCSGAIDDVAAAACNDGSLCTLDSCVSGFGCMNQPLFETVIQVDLSPILNADVIVNGTAGNIDSTQDGLDQEGLCLLTQSAATVLLGQNGNGLPDSGTFAETVYHPEIHLPYSNTDDGLNAWRTTESASVTVDLPPANYSAVHLLATSGSGFSAIDVQLHYSDGTVGDYYTFLVDDWFNSIPNTWETYMLYDGGDRANTTGIQGYDVNAVAIFGMIVAANPAKIATKLTVTRFIDEGAVMALLGVVGVTAPVQSACDDGNPCTTHAGCDPSVGCVQINSTVSCDDGNACTQNDVCSGGQCVGETVMCSDSDPCTGDGCDPATGCVFDSFYEVVQLDLSAIADSDVVVNTSGAGLDSTQDSIDFSGYCLMTQSAAEKLLGTAGNGVPDDGVFAANSYHPEVILPYSTSSDGINAKRLSGDATTVLPVPNAAYKEIHFFGLHTVAANTIAVLLTYADGTSEYKYLTVPDWFAEITDTSTRYTLINGLDRADVAATLGYDVNDPAIFGFRVLPDPAKTLVHITIGRFSTHGTFVLFGATAVMIAHPEVCDDNDLCTTDTVCTAGTGCQHGDLSPKCNDGNPCTSDVCEPSTGECINTNEVALACDDGDLCTEVDTCTDGSCIGIPIICDDSEICTADMCSEGNCVFESFTKGVMIDVSSILDADVIVNGTAGNIDTTQQSMDTANLCFVTDTAAKTLLGPSGNGLPDDGFFPANAFHPDVQLGYTNTENGLNAKLSTGGTFTVPVADAPYTDIHVFVTCGSGSANYTMTLHYDDGFSASAAFAVPDWFVEITDTTSRYTLINGLDRANIAGTTAFDANDPAIFGLHMAADPTKTLNEISLARTSGNCVLTFFGAVGEVVDHPELCDDGNECTYALCTDGVGCQYKNHTNSCDDGEVCTMADQCENGVCAGLPILCDDNNPCTDDSCTLGSGCTFSNNAVSCDDNNPCTTLDVCSVGACGGTKIVGCNNTPVIQSVTLDSVYPGEWFVCEVDAVDLDLDNLVIQYLWEVTSSAGVTTGLDVSTATLDSDLVPRTGSLVCRVFVNDGQGAVESLSNTAVVLNHPPTVGEITLTGTGGGTYKYSTLTCKADLFLDDDGDTISTVKYTWTKNGTEVSSSVVPKDESVKLTGGGTGFTLGDVVMCSAFPYDGYDYGDPISKSVTIVNHAPVCKKAVITDTTIGDNESATCNCFAADDADIDINGQSCTWTKFDGTPMDITGCTISGSQVPSGWVFNCHVAPTDSFGPGVAASVETSRSGNQKVIWNATLTASPSVVYADPETELTCTWNAEPTDPDGSGTKTLVEWWYVSKNGSKTRQVGSPPLASYQTIKLSQLTTEHASPLSPEPGGKVYCKAHGADTTASSASSIPSTWATLTSQTITLSNTPATLVKFWNSHNNVTFGNTVPYGDAFECTVEISDPDPGNKIKMTVEKGTPSGIFDWTWTELTSSVSSSSATGSISYSIPTTPQDSKYLQCVAYVDEGSGYYAIATSNVYAADYATPQILAVAVKPDVSSPCEDRTCAITITDATAESNLTVGFSIQTRWFVDGVEVGTVNDFQATKGGPKTLSVKAVGVPVADGSEVVCAAKVTKSTVLTTAEMTSGPSTVSGDTPAITSAVVSEPARVGDTLTCTGGEIYAGCAANPSLNYAWYQDGVKVAGETNNTLDTSGFLGGQQVQCGVSVSDNGVGSGAETLSTPVVLDADQWTLTGEFDGDRAGTSVAVVGDLNGDGRAELAVGAPGAAWQDQTKAGKVYVVYGTSGEAVTELGNLENGILGVVLNGASGGWDANTSTCKVDTQLEKYACVNGNPGTTNGQFAAPRGDGLGTFLAPMGDVDGDGIADLLASAPYALSHGEYLAGEVYALSGGLLVDLATTDTPVAKIAASIVLEGETGFDQKSFYPSNDYAYDGHLFGYGLAGGDFDGDGRGDVVACAPNADTVSLQNGRTYFVSNPSATMWMGDFVDADGLTPYGAKIDGPENILDALFAHMGATSDNLGDINGDGIDDLLVGPAVGDVYNKQYVILGGHTVADVDLTNPDFDAVVEINEASWSFNFFVNSDFIEAVTVGRILFGSRSAGVGDVNGDGLDDLGVGALEFEGTQSQVEVAIVFGAIGLTTLDLDAADAGVGGFVIEGRPKEGSVDTGVLVFRIGDVNGDGLDDIGMVMGPSDGVTTNIVRLYVAFGKTDGMTVTLTDLENGQGGFTVDYEDWVNHIAYGDLDGDGLSDTVVGFGADGAGRVEVRFGRDHSGFITYRGTKDADTFVGTGTADFIVGGLGDDVLKGGGGADVIYGGGGNDWIESGADLVRIDGGVGVDTWAPTVDVDLTELRGKVRDIEKIDLGSDGAQTLTASDSTVLRMSPVSNTLMVAGDDVDCMDATAGEWVAEGEIEYNGEMWDRYIDGEAELWVDPGICTVFDPTLLTTAFEVPEGAAQGWPVGSLAAADPDGEVVSVTIAEGDPYGIFYFETNSATLYVQKGSLLDYETRTSWTLTVLMTDNSGLSSTGWVVISLLDVNEAPQFGESSATVTVQEGAANGTVVGLLLGTDGDLGDVLTYSLVSGNDDGAFAIDAASGLVTVNDGGYLDFEAEPQRTVGVRVTDSGGLFANATLQIELTDAEALVTAGTYAFATQNQSILSPDMPVGATSGTGTITHNLDHNIENDNVGVSLFGSLLKGVAMLSGTASGDITIDYGYELSSGGVSAYLPVDVSVTFPDQVQLGVPFIVGLTSDLNQNAKLWGTTLGADFWLNLTLEAVSVNLIASFGGNSTAKQMGPLSVVKYFYEDVKSENFTGVVASNIFGAGYDPDSVSCDFSDTTTALGTECSWALAYQLAAFGALFASESASGISGELEDLFTEDELVDYFNSGDYDGAVAKIKETYPDFNAQSGWEYYQELMQDNYGITLTDLDNLLVSSTITETALTVSLNFDGLLKETFQALIGGSESLPWWVKYDMPLSSLGFARIYMAVWSGFLDFVVQYKESFYLQFDGVTAKLKFEGGTTLDNVDMNQDLEVTLPMTEDTNGDGKVDVTMTLTANATFLHLLFLLPRFHYYGDTLGFEVTGYQYVYNSNGNVIGESKTNSSNMGPLKSSENWLTLTLADLSDSWPLEGLNQVTLKGTLQLAK
ncbi:MAG: FG-GAP repeat protein [Myxococcales bacterium]|nr:FG-GAP repeat protein [Myxococcales bacterium]